MTPTSSSLSAQNGYCQISSYAPGTSTGIDFGWNLVGVTGGLLGLGHDLVGGIELCFGTIGEDEDEESEGREEFEGDFFAGFAETSSICAPALSNTNSGTRSAPRSACHCGSSEFKRSLTSRMVRTRAIAINTRKVKRIAARDQFEEFSCWSLLSWEQQARKDDGLLLTHLLYYPTAP